MSAHPRPREVAEPRLLHVAITICTACLEGEGGECHTPGCALWINRAPDIPVTEYEEISVTHATDPLSPSADVVPSPTDRSAS